MINDYVVQWSTANRDNVAAQLMRSEINSFAIQNQASHLTSDPAGKVSSAKLLPEDHPSIEKRSCKRRDNNERPKYQNVRVSFSSAAFFFDSVLAVGGAAHRRSGWGCFHLSLPSTEMAERSSRTKFRRSENSRDRTNTRTPRAATC